jgi:signal recognition particle subunit SRP54
MSGLQGSGKTFPENWPIIFKQKNKKPLLVACDIYRPAAIQQLYVVGDSIELRFIQNLRIRISRNCTKCN